MAPVIPAPPVGAKAGQMLAALPDPSGVLEVQAQLAGEVHYGRMLDTGHEVAIKIIHYREGSESVEEDLASEIHVCQHLPAHANVLELIGVYRKARIVYELGLIKYTHSVMMVMQLCRCSLGDYARSLRNAVEDGDLPSAWDSRATALNERAVVHVVHQVLKGLAHLHRHNVWHRDIKGANILITSDMTIKVADFDVSTVGQDAARLNFSAIGTPHWMAPEMCGCSYPEGCSYDARVDVWSLGILVLELCESMPPHYRESGDHAMSLIPGSPSPQFRDPSAWSENLQDFLRQCMAKDYAKRPTTADLLQHAVFQGLNERQARNMLKKSPYMKTTTQSLGRTRQSAFLEANAVGKLFSGTELPHSDTDNLATADVLTEDSILATLAVRYKSNCIYTWVGEILIAVNPYKDVSLYTDHYRSQYNVQSPSIRPHVWAVAANCYHGLIHTRQDQSCVISGESGAGKTETAKFFIDHLLTLSEATSPELAPRNDILQFTMNTLLEAFGNAATRANSNSSRFGKYVDIQFDSQFHVVGARLSHYLLEKSRVAHQGEGEKNFHIFYYLFAGLDGELFEDMALDPNPASYAYLNGGVTPRKAQAGAKPLAVEYPPMAAVTFQLLVQSMDDAGFRDDDVEDMLITLCIILHIGNIDFKELHDTGHYFELEVDGPIDEASELIGCPADDLRNALSTNILVTRGETIVLRNTEDAARDARDAMAKALYSRLFSWIVNRVNSFTAPGEGTTVAFNVGVLDIFGFEDVGKNGLEQLCINVANEQLQELFNKSVFAWQLKELAREGINVSRIDYTNNEEIVQMLLGSPIGLFALLDEESRFPQATDLSLVKKLRQNLKTAAFVPSNNHKLTEFTVQHFAGAITYSTKGWLEKNRETLGPSVSGILQESEVPLIQDMFSTSMTTTGALKPNEPEGKQQKRQENARELIEALRSSVWQQKHLPGGRGLSKKLKAKAVAPAETSDKVLKVAAFGETNKTSKRGPATVSAYFKASLHHLLAKLSVTVPSFVRCVQPNKSRSSDAFEEAVVLTQLRYTGVLETIRIRRDGYAARIPFADFVSRYQILEYPLSSKVPPTPETCRVLLKHAIHARPDSDWQMGRTKVFMKYHVEQFLSRAVGMYFFQGAKLVKLIRRYLSRRRLAKELERRIAERMAAAKRKIEEERLAALQRALELEEKKQREEAERKRLAEETKRQEEETRRLAEEARRQAEEEEQRRAAEEALRKEEAERAASLAESESAARVATATVGSAVQAALETSSARSQEQAAAKPKRLSVPQIKKEKQGFVRRLSKRMAGSVRPPPNCGEEISEDEFWQLEERLSEISDLPQDAVFLCRYKNILPNPKTRVPLGLVNDKDGQPIANSDFINANYMRGHNKDRDNRPYIATQGPKVETIDHFWRMVWEQNSRNIIMLTDFMEGGRRKCDRYWPRKQRPVEVLRPSGIKLTLAEVEASREFITSLIEVEKDGEMREITHIQYLDWPDHGVPTSSRSLLAVLEYGRSLQASSPGPLITHCSAGIGRTGIWVGLDIAMNCILEYHEVDIVDVIAQMREDRGGMVQTYEQYLFMRNAIGAFARQQGITDAMFEELDPVLKQALLHARRFAPGGRYMHDSQRDVDEGAEDQVPTWRQKQRSAKELILDTHHMSMPETRRTQRHFTKKEHRRRSQEKARALITQVEGGEEAPAAEEENPYDTLDFPFTSGWPASVVPDLRLDPSNKRQPIWATLFYYENDELLHACPISEHKFTVQGGSGMDNPGLAHLANIKHPERSADASQLLQRFGPGLRLVFDPEEGDVYMASFSAQAVRVKGMEGLVNVWQKQDSPSKKQQMRRRKSLMQGQQMRIFNSDTLRAELDAIQEQGYGSQELRETLKLCQVDIVLGNNEDSNAAILRLHFDAAAAEIRRSFALHGSRRDSVRNLLKSPTKWLESAAQDSGTDRRTSLKHSSRAHFAVSAPPSRQTSITRLASVDEGMDGVPPPPPARPSRPAPTAVINSVEVDVPPPPPPPPPPSGPASAGDVHLRHVSTKKIRPGQTDEQPEPYVLNLKRPPKVIVVKKKREYPYHENANNGPTAFCEDGFSPNMFIKDKCRNCGYTHPLKTEPAPAPRPAVDPTEEQAAVVLQSAYRGFKVRRESKEQEEAAIKLQSAYRGFKMRRESKEQEQAAVKLQSAFRGFKTRKELGGSDAPAAPAPAAAPVAAPVAAPAMAPQKSVHFGAKSRWKDIGKTVIETQREERRKKNGITQTFQRLANRLSLRRIPSGSLGRTSSKRNRGSPARRRRSRRVAPSSSSLAPMADESDEDEFAGDFNDDETMAFFAELELNREKRAKEAAQRASALAAEMAEQKRLEEEELDRERAAIKLQQQEEAHQKDLRETEYVKQTEERLEGLDFGGFSWGAPAFNSNPAPPPAAADEAKAKREREEAAQKQKREEEQARKRREAEEALRRRDEEEAEAARAKAAEAAAAAAEEAARKAKDEEELAAQKKQEAEEAAAFAVVAAEIAASEARKLHEEVEETERERAAEEAEGGEEEAEADRGRTTIVVTEAPVADPVLDGADAEEAEDRLSPLPDRLSPSPSTSPMPPMDGEATKDTMGNTREIANQFIKDYSRQYPAGDVEAVEAKVRELSVMFFEVDRDMGGDLDVEEVMLAMDRVGRHHSRPESLLLLAQVDDDNTGTLDLREFLNLMLLESRFIPDPVKPNGGQKEKRASRRRTRRSKRGPRLRHNQVIVRKKRGHLKLDCELDGRDGHFILSVHVDKAQSLLACDSNGLSDPYVKLDVVPALSGISETKKKTRVHKKTLEPDFDEVFTWSFEGKSQLKNRKLVVTMWDWDMMSRNDFMGAMAFPLDHIADPETPTSGWFILLDEAHGQLQYFPSRLDELSSNVATRRVSRLEEALRPGTDEGSSTKVGPDDFQYLKMLGKGSFGKVLLAQRKDGKHGLFAVKVLKKQGVIDNDDVAATMMEKQVLTMRNRFLVHCVASFQSPGCLYFVMELVQGGDLLNRCASKGRLSVADTAFYTAEICLGLFYLHGVDVIHRDLKLENVMLDRDGHVKLTDFGLAKEVTATQKASTFCGTPQYLAPEIVMYRPYGKECDFWSLGVMVYEMVNGHSLFAGDDMEETFDQIRRMKIGMTRVMAGHCGTFCKRLLNRNPRRRLGAGRDGEASIRADPFFAKLNWPALEAGKARAPWVPKIKGKTDMGNFDKMFTRQKPALSVVKKEVAANIDQQLFVGFSFVEHNAL